MENKATHTPEPWMLGADDGMKGVYPDKSRPFIVGSFNHNFEELARANCARAVACVNALAGISDPVAFRKCFEKLIDAADRAVLKMHAAWTDNDGGSFAFTADDTRELESALQTARTFTKES